VAELDDLLADRLPQRVRALVVRSSRRSRGADVDAVDHVAIVWEEETERQRDEETE
jgi:hypothetical protein